MKFKRRHNNEPVFINLTPLIDIVFLLLIFFMVSTSFNEERRLRLELPQAQDAGPMQQERQVLEIVINAQGKYAVNDKILPDTQVDTLKTALQAHIRKGETVALNVAADARTSHQSVVTVMDAARQLGLTQLTLTTQNAH